MNIAFTVTGVIFLILLWCRMDYYLGRANQLRIIDLPKRKFRNSQIELFTDGEVFFKDYFNELRKATKHIHILFYIVKNDKFSQEFLQILMDKAREGVEVRLLLDWAGSLKVKRKMIKDLKEAGVKFGYCHKPRLPYLFYSLQTRNHRKLSIVDGVTGYIGGFNVGKEYVNKDEKLSPWRDYQLKIAGEGVQDLQCEFLTDWKQTMKINLLQKDVYFPTSEPGPMKHTIVPSEGVLLEHTFLKLIHSARDTITIGTPYFIPSQTIYHALHGALKRGVNIRILVPKIADHALVKEASFPYLRGLIKEGANVFQYLNGFYHAKTLMIDNAVCDIGTANFDKRSFFLNHEINCYIYDKQFIQKAKDTMETDLRDSKPLTLEELNQPNLWRSVKEKVATVFSHFI